jgi:hypothetical protein
VLGLDIVAELGAAAVAGDRSDGARPLLDRAAAGAE